MPRPGFEPISEELHRPELLKDALPTELPRRGSSNTEVETTLASKFIRFRNTCIILMLLEKLMEECLVLA